jgi:hypothetical protein
VLKLLAALGVLFYIYAIARIYRSWWSRHWINKSVWFVILSVIGAACVALFFH